MNPLHLWLWGAGVCAVVAWIAVILFRFYNSPDAERYRRAAMQGPFAPVSEADLAADEKRIRERG
jgi:hypothetical protein